jgi:hypothetical protein
MDGKSVSFLAAASLQTISLPVWANMGMCIAVERAIFHYSKQYRRPFWASAYANIVSLVLGYPVLMILLSKKLATGKRSTSNSTIAANDHPARFALIGDGRRPSTISGVYRPPHTLIIPERCMTS